MSSSPLTICTHSGSFHADEALACFMLKQTNKYKDAQIIRSRDAAVVDKADVAVDVGAVYDLNRNRFDHHQAGFTETFDEQHETKLSSAGLVYKHFGKEIIKSRLSLNDECTSIIFNKVYNEFIEELDGVDNGIERYPIDIKPKYRVTSTIGQRVSTLNPNWNEPQTDELLGQRFEKAMQLMGETFLDKVDYFGNSWLPARSIVERALLTRREVHPSGQIIVLDQVCPWKDHLYELEAVHDVKEKPVLFCLFQDNLGSWRVQAVNLDGSFALRKALPEAWRGRRDKELSELVGIEGCIFTHANGFIGGHANKDGALVMAIKGLES
ncbi:hypothetical protein SAMD00019534_036950 [Acytostelium subglobosum LB1]|uniref:hypothetical protein n=1 Tax=Acytostelium subglobosum LB1 TaxID=1410327 RepID=UPI0006449561|nr:hypothetical protein SAMD00019534_036950 [Acytostelium subglobosum LB1]GAM20520.1 hypothetical protein SAMD00019534_036950 [Acytostelium subglobosum LB1]|eukprot:XP_012760041.1 hypothetical protein SAMD00019534_036950 [Acytostelium subglobosum LB1]